MTILNLLSVDTIDFTENSYPRLGPCHPDHVTGVIPKQRFWVAVVTLYFFNRCGTNRQYCAALLLVNVFS